MELLAETLRQTVQGCLPDFLRTSRPMLETRDLVYFMSTRSHFRSMSAIHAARGCLWWSPGHQQHRGAPTSHQCGTDLKALPAPKWRAVGWLRLRLRTEPWCTQTPTSNSSMYWPFGVHAMNNTRNPFFDTEAPQKPPQELPRHPFECFRKVDKGKVECFVGLDVLLLQ